MKGIRPEEEYGPHVEAFETMGVPIKKSKPEPSDVVMVSHPTKPEIKLPDTLYVEEEAGQYVGDASLKEVEFDLDPNDKVVFGVYVLKKFITVEMVSELKITED